MRFRLGIVGCLLTGCMMQPAMSTPRDSALAAVSAPASGPTLADDRAAARTPPPAFVLRIGIEHLPPESDDGEAPPRIQPSARAGVRPLRLARPGRNGADEALPATERPLLDFANADDPLAREALHFVSDLIDADRQRVRREVGLPFFDFRGSDPDRGPLLTSEIALQTDHEQWLQQHGTALLQRPLRQMLQRLPIVRDLEIAFEDFRSENVPLSEPWQQADERRRSGCVSLRVHADDLRDPVEAAWIWSGLRIGSSQEMGKVGLSLPLADALRLEVRARTEYATDHTGFRVDLSWRRSVSTSLHMALGDDMDFLSTSSIYSLFESPMDGSPGLVLYAVHIF